MMKIRCFQRQNGALTKVEVIVIIAVVALLVGFLLPALNHAKAVAQMITCNGNLKCIGSGFMVWERDHHTNFYPMSVSTNFGGTLEYIKTSETFRHFQIMSNELSTPRMLICPADVRQPAKDFGTTFGNTNISYFVGVDAVEPEPPWFLSAQMVLSGDGNFEIAGVPVKSGLLELPSNAPITWTSARHVSSRGLNCGNIGLADGSVQPVITSRLLEALQNSGLATNRLAIP